MNKQNERKLATYRKLVARMNAIWKDEKSTDQLRRDALAAVSNYRHWCLQADDTLREQACLIEKEENICR